MSLALQLWLSSTSSAAEPTSWLEMCIQQGAVSLRFPYGNLEWPVTARCSRGTGTLDAASVREIGGHRIELLDSTGSSSGASCRTKSVKMKGTVVRIKGTCDLRAVGGERDQDGAHKFVVETFVEFEVASVEEYSASLPEQEAPTAGFYEASRNINPDVTDQKVEEVWDNLLTSSYRTARMEVEESVRSMLVGTLTSSQGDRYSGIVIRFPSSGAW